MPAAGSMQLALSHPHTQPASITRPCIQHLQCNCCAHKAALGPVAASYALYSPIHSIHLACLAAHVGEAQEGGAG